MCIRDSSDHTCDHTRDHTRCDHTRDHTRRDHARHYTTESPPTRYHSLHSPKTRTNREEAPEPKKSRRARRATSKAVKSQAAATRKLLQERAIRRALAPRTTDTSFTRKVKNAVFRCKPRDSELRGNLEMFLSEANCRKFVERNPGLQRQAAYSIEDIDICDKLTPKQRQILVDLIKEFEAIFAKDDSEPPVMNPKYIKPVDFKLKESEKDSVAHCAKPILGKHQQQIMKTYRERGQEQGFLTPSTSNFAARVHMTFKPPGPPIKDEIRFAWDFRAANRLQAKLPNNMPNMTLQLQKQVNSRYLTSTDAKKGYHQLSITERTAELLAAWMDDGLYQPNRLVEGAINSGHYYQAAVNRALQHLPDKVREKVSNLSLIHI